MKQKQHTMLAVIQNTVQSIHRCFQQWLHNGVHCIRSLGNCFEGRIMDK